MNKESKYYKEARKKVLEKRRPYQKKRVIIPVITALVFLFIGIFGLIYSNFYQTTDDAFVEAHLVSFAPKVSGQITELNIDDNQDVKKGEIIAQIDPKDFEVALESAIAKLEKARADLNVTAYDMQKMNAYEKQTRADIQSAKSKLEYANSDYVRYKNAYKDGSVTKQDLDNAIKNLDVARSRFTAAQHNLTASKNAYISAKSKKISQSAEIKKLTAEVEKAQLDLSYTTLISPIEGTITNKTVQIGNYVQAAHPILTIVPKDVYVIANFKETQLTHMKKGQPVIIKIDTYKSKEFKGVVDSIQRSSGAKASLFPPENAVGSYVKVVQRVPVKIKFTEDLSDYINVVPGLSVVAKVKVR